MTAIINGSSPTVTFSDGTTQATSAIVSGYVPYANLPAGSVLQVINAASNTFQSTTSSTWSDTSVTATITPKFATSKILVLTSIGGAAKQTNNTSVGLRVMRNATAIITFESSLNYTGTSVYASSSGSTSFLDSPATTSATTYKVQFNSGQNLGTAYVQDGNGTTTSTITLMEIAQ
jgi:hypothetical protein